MAGGLRYETGRDMPPGMAEKVAVQLARKLEAEALAQRSDQPQVVDSKPDVSIKGVLENDCNSRTEEDCGLE